MKINNIILHNFGSYEGTTDFDTRPCNGRNIVLIGGKNGAGKTTLFTAMRLCLYGYKSMGYKNPNSFYNRAVVKLINNTAKITNPGFKTVYRIYDVATGKAEADLIALRDDKIDFTKPLTVYHPTERWKSTTFTDYTVRELPVKVVENGKSVYDFPKLADISAYAKKDVDTFWDEYKRLDQPHIFKVDLSDGLYALKSDMLKRVRNGEIL